MVLALSYSVFGHWPLRGSQWVCNHSFVINYGVYIEAQSIHNLIIDGAILCNISMHLYKIPAVGFINRDALKKCHRKINDFVEKKPKINWKFCLKRVKGNQRNNQIMVYFRGKNNTQKITSKNLINFQKNTSKTFLKWLKNLNKCWTKCLKKP